MKFDEDSKNVMSFIVASYSLTRNLISGSVSLATK